MISRVISFARGHWAVILLWLTSRAWLAMLLWYPEWGVVGDVTYYHDSLGRLAQDGVSGTLVEYPVPALLLLWLPYAGVHLLALTGDSFVIAVAAMAALTDLLFVTLLVRNRRGPARLGVTGAELVWLAAVPALGATTYARFDLFPGIMVGLAVLYVIRRPRVAAVLAALATGAKYWPALVVPALAAPRHSRRRVLTTVAATGLWLALLSLALGGWHRLFTPFDYQSARGLQIESVAATPAMYAWGRGDFRYSVDYTRWKAYDISGPVVDLMLHVAGAAMLVGGVLILAWWVLAWLRLRRCHAHEETLVWLVLATVGVFLVTNKVLSPQYLLWLLPAASAGLVLLRGGAAVRLGVWSAVLLVTALLTHEIFPRMYGYMLQWDPVGSPWITRVLVVRNGLLVALVAYAAWRTTCLLLRRRAEESVPTPEEARPTEVDDSSTVGTDPSAVA